MADEHPSPELVAYRVGTLEGKVDAHNEHLQRLGDSTRDLAASLARVTQQLDEWKKDREQEEQNRVVRQERTKANITWWIVTATTITSAIQTLVSHTLLK